MAEREIGGGEGWIRLGGRLEIGPGILEQPALRDGIRDNTLEPLRVPERAAQLERPGLLRPQLEGASGVLDRVAALQTEVSLQALYEGVADLAQVLDVLRERGLSPMTVAHSSRTILQQAGDSYLTPIQRASVRPTPGGSGPSAVAREVLSEPEA